MRRVKTMLFPLAVNNDSAKENTVDIKSLRCKHDLCLT